MKKTLIGELPGRCDGPWPRDCSKIALSEAARSALLKEADVMRFASVDEDGLPHVVPVVFTEIDGSIYFETDADSVKTRSVERTGKAAGVVDLGKGDYSQHRGLHWRGNAYIVDDPDVEQAVERGIFGTLRSV